MFLILYLLQLPEEGDKGSNEYTVQYVRGLSGGETLCIRAVHKSRQFEFHCPKITERDRRMNDAVLMNDDDVMIYINMKRK